MGQESERRLDEQEREQRRLREQQAEHGYTPPIRPFEDDRD